MTTQKQKPLPRNLKNNPETKIAFIDHLHELIYRFYFWLIFFVGGSILGYLNYPKLLAWLIAPLDQPLFYTSPIGGFEAVFKVSTMFGLIFSVPVLLLQVIKYVEPLLGKIKTRTVIFYLGTSCLLAGVGIVSAYYLVFPASLKFLTRFGSDQLEALISTTDYFKFISRYLIGFTIIFQFPLAIHLSSLIVPITLADLLQNFKFIIIGCFIIAAILTPTPDIINQIIMVTPIILLYVVTLLIFYFKKNMVKIS